MKGQGSCQQPGIGKFSHVFTECDTCCSPKCSGIVEALLLVSVFSALLHLGEGEHFQCLSQLHLFAVKRKVVTPPVLRVSLWISVPGWGSPEGHQCPLAALGTCQCSSTDIPSQEWTAQLPHPSPAKQEHLLTLRKGGPYPLAGHFGKNRTTKARNPRLA